ncbi:hypothetical protein GCM10023184_39350 [Flaviaesturariibacter amylovorans]|uniref:Uncharacterized protein n=1 Tax=Flaviaesturariibacter amylovorans TaxID=1084520 RepID=A0ABP8HLZ4_9BACT
MESFENNKIWTVHLNVKPVAGIKLESNFRNAGQFCKKRVKAKAKLAAALPQVQYAAQKTTA